MKPIPITEAEATALVNATLVDGNNPGRSVPLAFGPGYLALEITPGRDGQSSPDRWALELLADLRELPRS